MTFRTLFTLPLLLTTTFLAAQGTVALLGKPFTKELKGSTGDLFTVVDGLFAADGRHVLYAEEGLTPKVVRLDAQLMPTEELVLKDVIIDAVKWTGVTAWVENAQLNCLLVSNGKKSASYAIAKVNSSGPLALAPLVRVAEFDVLYANDPANTLVTRPLPDPILFTKGLAYAQDERVVRATTGDLLVNHYTQQGKGNKQFHFACLTADLSAKWKGSVELPYDDVKSTIHQILFTPDGTIHLLVYVFQCKSEEQLGDKLCHELHYTTISEQGTVVKDILVDKDFVSSARLCDRGKGRVGMALRYGSLTGQPGLVLSFDPTDPKLKPTPLVDQRLPSIRKTKLMAFGDPAADPSKPVSRTAKVPDEIVDLRTTSDGGVMVVETFLENQFMLPMGDAVAMRHLCGSVRTSQIGANDSIQWQRIADRALMTTAGLAYEGVQWIDLPSGPLLLHGHTPRGFPAIMRAGTEAGSAGKGALPAEPMVVKAVHLSAGGEVKAEGTLMGMEETFIPCPGDVLLEPATAGGSGGTRVLMKLYDRGTSYRFAVVDLARVGQ